jgi:hypothetical protein
MLCMLLFLREDEVYKLDLFPFIGNHPLLGTTSVQPLHRPLTHNSNSGISCIWTSGLDIPLWHSYSFLYNFDKCRLNTLRAFESLNFRWRIMYDWRNVRYTDIETSYFVIIMHKLSAVSFTFIPTLATYQICSTKRLELFLQSSTSCQ